MICDFIINQRKKTQADITLYLKIDQNKWKIPILGCGAITSKEQGLNFIGFKMSVLDLIESKTEEELKKILDHEVQKMCKNCQKGFKKYELCCRDDMLTFIKCEYISRGLGRQ